MALHERALSLNPNLAMAWALSAIAFAYMGDYIALVTDGSHDYFAWGDNRDRVRDFTFPAGRYDPDVFFAKR